MVTVLASASGSLLLRAQDVASGTARVESHVSAPPRSSASGSAVRVWEDTMVLPTYDEGPPDVNPPFDLFVSGRFNYPYTIRNQVTNRRAPRTWRTLNLENEYLRCIVLPDLGGHLYNCVDRVGGEDLFYANTALKFANVAYRGAWVALGIEFNFPVSHNWMTVSPVDYATTVAPDGSASIWIGNIDRVYGGQWRVQLTLRPGRAVLEQHAWLYNGSPNRHRFYWWTNAAVRATDDSRMIYPMRFTASHGFTEVDTWPVNKRGVDLSTIRTHTSGPVSLFSHGSREPFMAVYQPRTDSGVVHYSSPTDLPAKKFWSWGADADALDWREALSDDKSAYVVVQAGLFRNQETYAFLEPEETIAFDACWLPFRGLGGLTRATPNASLHLTRTPAASGRVTLDAAILTTRRVRDGRLRLLDGGRVVGERPVSADPAHVLKQSFADLPGAPSYTVELVDAEGVLIRHTEGVFDYAPAGEIKTGPQPTFELPPARQRSADQVLEGARADELEGRRLEAYRAYVEGLRRFPESVGLAKAAGRLALQLKRPEEAIEYLTKAAARITNDPETEYYLGEAHVLTGDDWHARGAFDLAQQRSAFRVPARLQLARLDARAGDLRAAEHMLAAVAGESPHAVRVGEAHVAVLRHLQRASDARAALASWQTEDPTNSALRYEAVRLGQDDPGLWRHLAADPDRLLELSSGYMALGFYDDAVDLLSHPLPDDPAMVTEPGMPRAGENPLIAYYRGYCRLRAGKSPDADFEAAARRPTTYVFPNRPESFRVLNAALERNPQDANAHFLLGSLYLSGGRIEPALDHWNRARAINPRIPSLHRNIGLTYLRGLDQPDRAADVLRDGLTADPGNVGLYLALDEALGRLHRPASERAAVLASFPASGSMPPTLAFRLATALAESGRFDDAEATLRGRFFARTEGGTNVRQVYVNVRLLRAQAAARDHRCDAARHIVRQIDRPVEGFPFTAGGLGRFTRSTAAQELLADIDVKCGGKK
jgi:tetratricopeptide (TPR) repeat protein